MATDSSMLAWEIPWTEEPGSCSPWGHRELNSTEQMGTHVTVDTAKLAAFFQFCGHHAALCFQDIIAPVIMEAL